MQLTEHSADARDEALQHLVEFLSIPSVSAVPEHGPDIRRAAEWVADRLRAAGAQTAEIHQTPGHPIVLGRIDGPNDAPTVLVYGHYDVQPAEPLELWTSPPFSPTIRDGAIYARGASDDKGQLLAHIEAASALRRASSRLPVGLLYLIEGEEEIGSPSFEPWLQANAASLRADVALVSDTAMAGRGQPSITYGLRGLTYMEVSVRGPMRDLHSGQFGGAVLNPANALCRMIGALHSPDGRVAIEGFYDRVLPLDPAEREMLAGVPFDEAAFRSAVGAAGDFGEPGYSPLERMWTRPTLDVNGIWSGWTGRGAKTVLPSTAHAKISMRLVPDQQPHEIAHLFRQQLERLAPPGLEVTVVELHSADPAIVDRHSPVVAAAADALEVGFGRKPVFTREGGSIPVVSLLQSVLGLPTVLLGFGLPDDRPHAPDEKLDLDNYFGGIATIVALLERLGA